MKRGEVWQVNLDPTLGAEIQKTRPAVIVSHNALARLPLVIIVPITGWDEKFTQAAWHVKITAGVGSGLTKDSSADTFQVRSVSKTRLVNKLGALKDGDMERIEAGLRVAMDLG